MLLKSKTREAARNYSRQAGLHELNQANFPLAQIKGTSKIGSPTVDQLQLGVEFPNVQSAIDDLVQLYQTPVNGVIMTDDASYNPSGTNMIERLTISGVAKTSIVYVYGIPVAVGIGDNDVAVTVSVLNVLNKYKNAGIAIKNAVAVAGVNNQIDVTFMDTNPHENYNYSDSGISIRGATSTTAVPGYGSWRIIGTTTIKDTDNNNTVLTYHKRTA